MTSRDVVITLPRPHPSQRAVLAEAQRYNVLVCGRRWGKTQFSECYIMVDKLLRGEPVGYFAPTYKYVPEVWHDLLRILKPLRPQSNFSEKRIEIVTGGVLEMWTLDNKDAGRSRKYKTAVIDEAGLVAGLLERWHNAIRPTLMDLEGGAWFLGTPKGKNDYWLLYEKAGSEAGWARWQRPTHDNPHIPRGELDAAKAGMPEAAYRQEILAEFLEDGAGVFRNIRSAIYGDMPALVDVPAGEYVIGVDLGKVVDYTVFVVIELGSGRVAYIDRMQGEYTTQLERLKALCDRLAPRAVQIETNTGQMFIEQAYGLGLPVVPFTTTNATKMAIIDRLAIAFEHGAIAIPEYSPLVTELMAFEAERLPGGSIRYSAPDGQHDDTVMALAIAWNAAANGVGQVTGWRDNLLFG